MKRISIILTALILVFVLWSLTDTPDRKQQARASIGADIDAVMEGVTVVASRDGKVLWRLSTERAVMPSGAGVAMLGSIDLSIPAETLKVRSGSGVYDFKTSDLDLNDNVIADNGQFVLYADYARFEAKTGEVTSDSRVRVDGNGFDLIGRGFRAKGSNIEILNKVEALVD
jgi:LPS export ABC transporter protein LptC